MNKLHIIYYFLHVKTPNTITDVGCHHGTSSLALHKSTAVMSCKLYASCPSHFLAQSAPAPGSNLGMNTTSVMHYCLIKVRGKYK